MVNKELYNQEDSQINQDKERIFGDLDLSYFHHTWQEEIKDMSESEIENSREIRESFGILGLLIWLRLNRLWNRFEIARKRIDTKYTDDEAL